METNDNPPSDKELREKIMSLEIPKTHTEWWARKRILELESAIENLREVKGRHHTEIACKQLYKLLPENH